MDGDAMSELEFTVSDLMESSDPSGMSNLTTRTRTSE
jgi:hypothetical protein